MLAKIIKERQIGKMVVVAVMVQNKNLRVMIRKMRIRIWMMII